jgi:hypothetical protein
MHGSPHPIQPVLKLQNREPELRRLLGRTWASNASVGDRFPIIRYPVDRQLRDTILDF